MKSVFVFCLALSVSLAMGGGVEAQDEDYTLTVDSPATVDLDEVFDVPFLMQNDGEDMQGYQWGVCQDNAFLTIADDPIDGVDAVDIDYTFEAVDHLTRRVRPCPAPESDEEEHGDDCMCCRG